MLVGLMLWIDAYSFENFSFDTLGKGFERFLSYAFGPTNMRYNNDYLYPYCYKGSRGHCRGMASSSSVYLRHPEKKPPTVRNFSTYDMPCDTLYPPQHPDVVYYIILYQLQDLWTTPFRPDEAEDSIALWMRQGSVIEIDMADTVRTKNGSLGYSIGHAVSVYKMIRFGTDHVPTNDSSWVILYDSNFPNQPSTARFLKRTPAFSYYAGDHITGLLRYELFDGFRQDELVNALHSYLTNLAKYLNGKRSSAFALTQSTYDGPFLSFAMSGSDKLLITDRSGRRTGYVNETDLYNEIPGSNISFGSGANGTANDVVVIEVPKDDGYTISFFGQKADSLNLATISPETDTTTTNFLYADLPVVSGSQGTIQYDPHGASILSLDRNGDGSPDTSIAPLVGMAPFPFNLLWPTGGGRVNGTFPLKWTSSLNMDYQDTIFYQAYFAKDSLFSSPESTVVTRDISINIGNLDMNTVYYWKIKAFDTQGNYIWSQLDSFHVVTFKPGDVNGDGKLSVSDVVYLINYLFKGGPAPVPIETGDPNYDGKATVADVVYLINYLFKGGLPPRF